MARQCYRASPFGSIEWFNLTFMGKTPKKLLASPFIAIGVSLVFIATLIRLLREVKYCNSKNPIFVYANSGLSVSFA